MEYGSDESYTDDYDYNDGDYDDDYYDDESEYDIIRDFSNGFAEGFQDGASHGHSGTAFADGNISVGEDGIITLPLYMIAFISFIHLPRLVPPQIWKRVLPALRPAAFWGSRSFCMFLR